MQSIYWRAPKSSDSVSVSIIGGHLPFFLLCVTKRPCWQTGWTLCTIVFKNPPLVQDLISPPPPGLQEGQSWETATRDP